MIPIEIKVPRMGEAVCEATIAQWFKKPGDVVKTGDDLVELETEKVNLTIPAEVDGVLIGIQRQVGDTVHPGDVVATVYGERAPEEQNQPALLQSPGCLNATILIACLLTLVVLIN
jgi:pyruvate/2-oxoglutarate dehydrogenase complex dihydrolipoamide acyltransferase (E2) component